ncbi:MAG TPA: hypothetical protein VF334_08145 [Polyangia bacterium]
MRMLLAAPPAAAALALALAGGCATSLRIGAAPTVDSDGKWGAVVTLGAALGDAYRHGAAAILVAAEAGGAVDERARTRGNAGHVAFGLGLDALGESPRFGFRIGATLDGRVVLPTGAPGGAVGARLALLPVVHATHHGRRPERCGESESWTYWHIGLELSGQYLWGPDARGLFAAGPVFELDALADQICR